MRAMAIGEVPSPWGPFKTPLLGTPGLLERGTAASVNTGPHCQLYTLCLLYIEPGLLSLWQASSIPRKKRTTKGFYHANMLEALLWVSIKVYKQQGIQIRRL